MAPEQEPVTKTEINKAVGSELRRVRDGLGWSRDQTVARMSADISVQSLANYECGLRPVTLPMLADICAAYGISLTLVVGLAMQRCGIEPEVHPQFVDLNLAATVDGVPPSVRRWASRKLKLDPSETIARLDPATVAEMAMMSSNSVQDLRKTFRALMPARAPRIVDWEDGLSE